MLRVLDELLWTLRRAGFVISTAQAIDVMRVVLAVGLDDRRTLEQGLALVIVQRAGDQKRFAIAFGQFFEHQYSLKDRDFRSKLRSQGVDAAAIATLEALLYAMASEDMHDPQNGSALLFALFDNAEFTYLLMLTDVQRELRSMMGSLQIGYYAQRIFAHIGISEAHRSLLRIRRELEAALGAEAAEQLIGSLTRELSGVRKEIRMFLEQTLSGLEQDTNAQRDVRDTSFLELKEEEIEEVRRAVRTLAERLRGAARVRERHSGRGRIDRSATLRRALRTAGVPITLAYRTKRSDRPKLWVLCDISDSVRAASGFMLEFSAASQELFQRTRTFVFVSELAETTELFEKEPVAKAIAQAYDGSLVNVAANSNYGRVLRQFQERYGKQLDRRSTVVMVGDGRTNYQSAEVPIVRWIRDRVGAFLWLCPETPSRWGLADSAMLFYAKEVTAVMPACTARELERAAREIVLRR